MLQRRGEWNISVLVPLDHRYAEARSEQRVFSEGFPKTRPAGIAAQIEYGRKIPRNAARSNLLCCGRCVFSNERFIPCGGQPDLLWTKHCLSRVRWTVYGIDPVQNRNARCFARRMLLNPRDEFVPFLRRMGMISAIENASHLVIHEGLPCTRGIEVLRLDDCFVFLLQDDSQSELGHLPHLGLQTHRCDQGINERLFLRDFAFGSTAACNEAQ